MYRLLYIPTGEYLYIKANRSYPTEDCLIYFKHETKVYESIKFILLEGNKEKIEKIIKYNLKVGVSLYLGTKPTDEILLKNHLSSFELVEV